MVAGGKRVSLTLSEHEGGLHDEDRNVARYARCRGYGGGPLFSANLLSNAVSISGHSMQSMSSIIEHNNFNIRWSCVGWGRPSMYLI
jgi:hypothetical protein